LDITWLGHSCFRIKGKEATIITDPCSPETGYNPVKQKADIVTISHNHPTHSYTGMIEGEYKKLNSPGEYELKSVFITGIPTYHDKSNGTERGKNVVFVVEIDGVTICHLGDIGHTLSDSVIEGIGDIGVLFLPVGGLTTIDSTIAAEMVRSISPKIVIPMHYKTAVVSTDLEPVDRFLKKMGLKETVSQPKLSITKTTFTENTQVIVLNYPNQQE
jgi:L-ascorbate metabolism protein UlaG (beta-lactamase superfamily)